MHIFIKVWGEKDYRGKERLSFLSTYLPYIVVLSLSQKISRSLYARSIVFYPPIKNASMQRDFTNPSRQSVPNVIKKSD